MADNIQLAAKRLIVPTAVSALLGCVYSGFLVYGINTLHVVFGEEEARRILSPSNEHLSVISRMDKSPFFSLQKALLKIMDPFLPTSAIDSSWKLFVGLPMVAPTLVLSRTRIADQFFAVIPITASLSALSDLVIMFMIVF